MANETKFTGKADHYSKYRSSYPTKLLDYLTKQIPTGQVADIGAGTGIFTLSLLTRGYDVLAVEPNEDMRIKARELLKIEILPGTAEKTGIASHSVDLITVAQAFHWFNADSFKKECQRILKPHGKVALIWNHRDETTELIKDYAGINGKLCPDFKGFSQGFNTHAINSFFKGSHFQCLKLTHPQQLTRDEFIGRALSSSYAPKEQDSNFNTYVKAISNLFNKYQQEGVLYYPEITTLYLGEV